MALRVIASAVLAASLGAWPVAVRAADPLKPLRTLTYEIAVSIGIVRRTPRSGLGPVGSSGPRRGRLPPPRPAGQAAGPESAVGAKLDAAGSMAVDVIAATADGGLVIDISENAVGRTRPKVRFAITHEGEVAYDPKHADDVSDEEVALARWFSRGFYGDHPEQTGATWTIDRSGNGLTGAEHYRVTAVDEHAVTLDYVAERKAEGPDPFASTQRGLLVYDTALIVPLRISYQDDTRREYFAAYDETRTSVVLKLTSDSFAKKK